MIDEVLNIDEITEAYLFSNNAMSLIRALKQSSSIKEVARRFSSQNLDDEFSNLLDNDIVTYEQIAKLYSLYFAMTLKPKREVEFFFDKYHGLNFEWFPDIRKNLYDSGSLVTVLNLGEVFPENIHNESSTIREHTSSIILINQ